MLKTSAAFTIGNYDGTNGLGVGDSYGFGSEWKGYVDEARVSSTARSQDWITTEYNNQNSPSTFLALSDAPGAGSNTTYAYDYRNRMTGTSGSATSSYGYDVSGERVKAVLGGVTTISPTRGYSLEGSTPIKQIYAGSMLVATVKGTGASATTYTVATDHLTGSNAISNGSGALEELLDYYPYGSVRLDEKAGSFDQKRKFAGHEYDSDTGLSYMVARYYDGGVARFYGQDQLFWSSQRLADPQSLNAYSYAENNPLRYVDPDGKQATDTAIVSSLGALGYLLVGGVEVAGGAIVGFAGAVLTFTPVMSLYNVYTSVQQAPPPPSVPQASEAYGPPVPVQLTIEPVGNGPTVSSNRSGGKSAPGPQNSGPTPIKPPEQTKNEPYTGDVTGPAAKNPMIREIKLGDGKTNPSAPFNFKDPTQAPGKDWVWRGRGDPGSRDGGWFNPKTGESWHNDSSHPAGKAPHVSWRNRVTNENKEYAIPK